MKPAGDTMLDRFFYRNTRALFFPIALTAIVYQTYMNTWLEVYRA